MIRVVTLALLFTALPLGLVAGCASGLGMRQNLIAEPGGTPGRLGLTEASHARVRWRQAGEPGMRDQPSHWAGSLIIRALEPLPHLKDIKSADTDLALPEGIYPAGLAEPTQRYIEVLRLWDDTGRMHSDASEGDGTVPRFDIMLSDRFYGHYARRDPTIGVGLSMDDDHASTVSARGNIVLPRFTSRREVLLPLDTLRAADMGTLSFGRGRSLRISQSMERVRVGREMQDQLVEEVTIHVDLATNSTESLPIRLAVMTEDGRAHPVTRWHSTGGGISRAGWSTAMRPVEADPSGVATTLRITLADGVEFERRPFELRDVPIEYAPKPDPEAAGS